MVEKKFKQVCECKKCGNEAEMLISCTLQEEEVKAAEPTVVPKSAGKKKGHAVCSHCGNEAEIWLDI